MQGSGGADCETASNVRRHRGYRWTMGQDRNIDMEIHRSSSNSSCTTNSAKVILLLGTLVMIVMVFPSLVSDEGQVHDYVSQKLRPTSWKGSRAHHQRRLRSLRCAQQNCGDMEIPYPFGLSSDCAMNSFFELECIFTRGINEIGEYEIGLWPFLTNVAAGVAAGSYQSLANDSVVPYDFSANSFQVLNISDNKIVIETTRIKAMSCWGDDQIYGNASISLPDDGPYRLSGDNILAAVGCRSRVRYSVTSDDAVAGVCGPNSCNNQNYYHYCNTYDCCTMSIQPALNIRLTGGGIAFQYFSTCGYASLLWPDSYRTSHSAFFGNGTYGTELLWAIPVVAQPMNDTLCDDGPGSVKDSPDYVCARTMAKCKNVRIKSSDDSASEMTGYYCTCKRGYEGDGYKNGSSCTDIDECADDSLNECVPGAVCTNLPGSYSCSCQSGAQGDGFTNGTGCTGSGGPNTPLIVGLSTVSGALVVVTLGGLCLWWYYRRQRKNQPVDPTLSRMDILREMQIKGGANICKIFMLEELEKATSNFADHKVIGVGGFGKIYQGTLDDGTEVAIKKAKRDVTGGRDDTKQFINEVTILSTINHQNLVKLLGCCLETMVPILVYEFISNGSLLDYIQRSKSLPNKRFDEASSKSLDWDQRLKIAVGTATALSYLHSGTSPPIYHRDVKSANILLDKNYVAKVADFGLSKLVPADEEETHVSTAVQGTPGYLDPEYFEIYQLTEKSDVYSFGVVLLELLTAEKALDFSRPGQDQNLALRCRRLLKFGLFEQVLDSSLDAPSHPDVLEAVYNVAQVAMECCERYGDNRPTMRQVENRLRSLRESSGLRSPSSYTSNVTDRGRTGYIGYDLETDDTYDSTPITSREFTNSEDPIHSNKFASGSSDSGGHIRQRSRDLELGNMRRKQRYLK